MQAEALPDPDSPFTFLLAFAVIWTGMCLLLSVIGGWRRLAAYYRAGARVEVERWRFQTAGMRYAAMYGSCLTVGVHPNGLLLEMLFLFRAGHPPLLIPWSDIRKGGPSRWLKGRQLRFSRAPDVPLALPDALVQRIEAARGGALPNTD